MQRHTSVEHVRSTATSLKRLVLATLPPLVALIVQSLLWRYIDPYVWFLFYPAVFVSSWIGGLRAGIVATLLATASVLWFFVPPQHSFVKAPELYFPASVFVGMGVLFGAFHDRLRKANERTARLYEKTKELDALKTRFFASVSHELRTPLSLILGPTERLLRAGDTPEAARRDLDVVVRNARTLLGHVNDLLDIAKLEAGRAEPDYAETDVASLARFVAGHFEVLASETGTTLRVDAPDTLPAQVDPEKVQRILLNLLSNAFKFTPACGRIRVTVRGTPERIFLEVADSGPGIAPEQREAAFERFRQLEGDVNRRRGGTGLGLSIAREFAALHEGAIEISEAPEGGALFVVELPRTAPRGAFVRPKVDAAEQPAEVRHAVEELRPRAAMDGRPSGRAEGPLVLVVEDNPEMNRFIAENLSADYRVAVAFDGREGLEKAKTLRPDLILTDIMMPEMSGDELVREVRLCPDLESTPIVVLSAKEDDALRVRLLREGAQDYLTKPFSVDELRARASNFVSKKLTDELLRQANEAIATLVEQAPDGILVTNPDERITEVNDAGCRMLGYARDQLLGRAILELLPGADPERVSQARQELAGGATHTGEWTFQRKDGSLFPAEISAKILGDGRRQLFVRDVSVRKELEERLREAHEDLLRAQSVAKVGSWRLDLRRNELVWSDESHRIFGVPLGTPMTYEGFLACVPEEDRALVDREWKAALQGRPYDLEHRVVADGTLKWVREKAELEFDEHGAPIGGIGITQDITERKRYEDELHEARERFELALRGADLGAWDWNIETGAVVFNARWAEMRGYRLEEIKGHVDTWTEGVHPDDWPRVQRVLDDYFEGRVPEYEAEHRVRTKDGRWIWILDRGRVFARNAQGRPIRMVGTELDITSRKRAEEELRLAEAKSSGIVSVSADAIVAIDEAQKITLFNEGAEKMFGCSREEALGAPLERFIPQRFRASHRRAVERFVAGREVARRMGGDTFGLRTNGEEFPTDANISKLEVAGTKVLTVSLRDVTEQKRLDREHRLLAEVGALFASTLEYDQTVNTIARMATRDLSDFCILDVVVEPEVQRQLVVSRDPEKAWICDLFHAIAIDRSRPHLMKAAFENRRPVLVERVTPEMVRSFAQSEEHLRALEALAPQSMILAPLLAHGEMLGALAFVSTSESRSYGLADLRLGEELALRAALAIENARLYRLARRAVQARDDVLGIVAHDLRNPLGSILMQAGLLRRPGGEPDRRSRQPAELIERAARRMNRLIQDLLDVSRIEAGRLSIERSPLPAAAVVLDALEAQKALASSASIEILSDVAPTLPELQGDRDRLLQVFENLIGNAFKFTRPGGRVTVGAAPRGTEVLFWVADTGAGIAAEDLPHVFEQFWQAQRARRAGAGLGLAIVKGIVEAHGGRVWVESTLGRGSIFFFTIPTQSQPPQWRPEPRASRT